MRNAGTSKLCKEEERQTGIRTEKSDSPPSPLELPQETVEPLGGFSSLIVSFITRSPSKRAAREPASLPSPAVAHGLPLPGIVVSFTFPRRVNVLRSYSLPSKSLKFESYIFFRLKGECLDEDVLTYMGMNHKDVMKAVKANGYKSLIMYSAIDHPALHEWLQTALPLDYAPAARRKRLKELDSMFF